MLNADQLVTLAYLCGRVGCALPRERRELMLQHALRLVRAGQEPAAGAGAGAGDGGGGAGGEGLDAGPLAAFLEGMSALPPAPDGGPLVQDHEQQLAQLLEVRVCGKVVWAGGVGVRREGRRGGMIGKGDEGRGMGLIGLGDKGRENGAGFGMRAAKRRKCVFCGHVGGCESRFAVQCKGGDLGLATAGTGRGAEMK